MNKKMRLSGVFVAIAMAWAALPPGVNAAPAAAEAEADAASTRDRLNDLEAELRRLRAELAELRKAGAGDPAGLQALEKQVQELARQVEILTQELERRQLGAAYGAAGESVHGLGPAASKVYGLDQGVSVGGYGEMLYQSLSGADDQLDFLRAVFYFGYKFDDRILFNSEIEFEHAQTGEGKDGEVAVEFAYLDFLLRKEFNIRAGLLLLPVGFLNELHEPPIFFGAVRPQVERVVLPATWRENGAGVFGEVASFAYRVYVVNGLDSGGFSASSGIRGGRQSGSKAAANDLAVTARADWTIVPGLQIGASVYVGNSGQDEEVMGEVLDGGVTLYDLHAEWKWRGLRVRGLWAQVDIEDADLVNHQNGLSGDESVGKTLAGWYGEVAYDVLSYRETEQQLSPYLRYESYNTQDAVPDGFLIDPGDPFRADAALDRSLLTVGVAYQPIPQVVLKVDFQDADNRAGNATDRFHVALGYLF